MNAGLRTGVEIAAALLALALACLGVRVALGLRGRRNAQGAALLMLALAGAVGALVLAGALVIGSDAHAAAAWIGIAAAVAVALSAFTLMRRPPAALVDGGAAQREASAAARRRARALSAAGTLAHAGGAAESREEILRLLGEAAREATGAQAALVVPGEAHDEAALAGELAEAGAPEQPFVAVPLMPAPPSSLVAVGPSEAPAAVRELLAPLADAGRASLSALDARREAALSRRFGGARAGLVQRLCALADTDAVGAALADELRTSLRVSCAGVLLAGEPERWYPAAARPEGPVDETPLFFDGVRIGSLAHVAPRPLSPDAADVLARLADAGALALGLARLRASRDRRATSEAALVRAAEALASELDAARVLGRLAAVAPELVGVEAAAVLVSEPDLDRLRVVAAYGFSTSLAGAVLSADAGPASEAITTGRPATGAEGSGHPALEVVRRQLAVPLSWVDARGVLLLAGTSARPAFAAEEIERASALARLAGHALENAEAFGERGRQARLDRAASLAASELAGARGLVETRDAIARAARAAFGADRALVRLGPDLASSPDGSAQPLELERMAARERRVVAAGRTAGDTRFAKAERGALGGTGALLLVPLVEPGGRATAGLVTLAWDEERTFGDEHLALAERVREAASAALERAVLEEAERRASALSRELRRVGALLAANLDERVVLREIARQAVALLNADACCLRLLVGDDLVVRSVEGEAAELLAAHRVAADDALVAEVLASPLGLAIPDLAGDARVPAGDVLVAQAGFAGYVGAPVASADGDVRGVLDVYDRRPRTWRPDEVDAVAALASSAAVALRNANLYERVAAEKEKGDAILGQIAEAIVAVDADGRVTVWNQTAAAALQLSERRTLGRRLSELLRSEFGDADGAAHAALEAAGELVPTEVRLVRGERERWLSVTAAPLRTPGEDEPGRVYAMRDVSEERQLDQIKSDFVATVSHELRTPLTSIYGFAETLLRQDVAFGDEDRETFLRYIASEAERLTRLVESLLSVTRLEAGAVQLTLATVDVASVVREVAGWAAGRSDKHGIEVVLPPGPLEADADPDRVRQILINLIDNAIKYSPEGGAVTVRAQARERVVEVRVSDRGIGISEVDQRNLFRKFFRVDAAMSRGIRGIGLGLYLVRGFVLAMGGRIWVESTEGEGSTFVFELPLARAASEEGRAA